MEARRLTENDKNWLRQRKAILKKIKRQVWLYLGPEPHDIRKYALEYKRDVRRTWKTSDLQTLHAQLLRSQLVFGGDFHPFAQAQRAHLRILRFLVQSKKICLGLEVFSQCHQQVVQDFMAKRITEGEFLKKVDWEGQWGFPWSHYRPLIEFARKNNVPILALNGPGVGQEDSLDARDAFAAEVLAKYYKENKETVIYTIYGDLHIAQKHLPKK